MALGLKRGVVELAEHDPEWATLAADIIARLWRVFGSAAMDIQHVGSTAVRGIKAKPIIDVAVAVDDFERVLALSPELEREGFIFRGWEGETERQPVYQCGEYVQGENDMRFLTHYIHIVKANGEQWRNYINFREYMNAFPEDAIAYEAAKVKAVGESGGSLHDYHMGKQDYVKGAIQAAYLWDCFGRKFTKIEPLNKGWSSDKKYYVETNEGRRLLLRVSDISELERKRAEFDMLKRVEELGVPASRPVDFGVCDGGMSCYQLLTWIDGEDAAEIIPRLTEKERYTLGLRSGELLRKLHELPAPENAEPWAVRFQHKIDERLSSYRENNVQSERGELVIKYLSDNAALLNDRPQTFNHGDFNTTNIIVSPIGEVGAVDFNAYNGDYGDPLWEMICVSYSETPDPYYYTGLWNSYCGGVPNDEFFTVTAYYFAYDVLTSLCGVGDCGFDNGGFDEKCLAWYDNFNRVVPSWYLRILSVFD